MRTHHLTVAGLLVVLAVAVVVPAVAVAEFGSAAVQEESTTNESELGVAVTSFAQSSAVDVQSSAEQGLWRAQANATFEQNATENETTELISDRATQLEQRLRALQNRTDRLEQKRANLSEAAYNARASALRSQVANVRSAIEQANRTAVSRGVNTTQLDRLRTTAANLTGPDVAAIARNITDPPRGPPDDVPGRQSDQRGPPADRGPPGDRASGNSTNGPPRPGAGNGTAGPPANSGAGNGTAGPPDADDRGSGNASNAGGSGNGGGPQDDKQASTDDSSQSDDSTEADSTEEESTEDESSEDDSTEDNSADDESPGKGGGPPEDRGR